MAAHILTSFSLTPNSPFFLRPKPPYPTAITLPPLTPTKSCRHLRALNTDGGNGSAEGNQNPTRLPPSPPQRQAQAPTEIRFRRGSRKRLKQQQGSSDEVLRSNPSPPKDWESMTLSEKIAEIYVGEKGLIFWLNKFAYASIFIIIGGWILFRFVGPSLGLYQLDTPPSAPSSIFKGS